MTITDENNPASNWTRFSPCQLDRDFEDNHEEFIQRLSVDALGTEYLHGPMRRLLASIVDVDDCLMAMNDSVGNDAVDDVNGLLIAGQTFHKRVHELANDIARLTRNHFLNHFAENCHDNTK
jgi:hypothetical protein